MRTGRWSAARATTWDGTGHDASGTPGAVVERVAQATRDTMADHEVQQLFIASGFEPDVDSNPQQTRDLLDREIAKWAPVIKAIGLKLD